MSNCSDVVTRLPIRYLFIGVFDSIIVPIDPYARSIGFRGIYAEHITPKWYIAIRLKSDDGTFSILCPKGNPCHRRQKEEKHKSSNISHIKMYLMFSVSAKIQFFLLQEA